MSSDDVFFCICWKLNQSFTLSLCLYGPHYQAISERFRDEVHDEVLYKSTFFFLCGFHCCSACGVDKPGIGTSWRQWVAVTGAGSCQNTVDSTRQRSVWYCIQSSWRRTWHVCQRRSVMVVFNLWLTLSLLVVPFMPPALYSAGCSFSHSHSQPYTHYAFVY